MDSIEQNFEKTEYLANYPLLYHLVLLHCLKERPAFLCDIPELYLRMIMNASYTLEETIEEFKSVLQIIKLRPNFWTPDSMSTLAFGSMNEISRYFYLRSFLEDVQKEKPEAKLAVFLRIDRFFAFEKYYQVEDLEHNWVQAFNVPFKRNNSETDEVLIEKHALFDVMFDTNLWGKEHVKNPFPYISEDFFSLKEEDIKEIKKKFYVNYKKYEKIKEEFLKM